MNERGYRLYHLSREGRIRGVFHHDFETDAAAMGHAHQMLERHPGVEVWRATRLVGALGRPVSSDYP